MERLCCVNLPSCKDFVQLKSAFVKLGFTWFKYLLNLVHYGISTNVRGKILCQFYVDEGPPYRKVRIQDAGFQGAFIIHVANHDKNAQVGYIYLYSLPTSLRSNQNIYVAMLIRSIYLSIYLSRSLLSIYLSRSLLSIYLSITFSLYLNQSIYMCV